MIRFLNSVVLIWVFGLSAWAQEQQTPPEAPPIPPVPDILENLKPQTPNPETEPLEPENPEAETADAAAPKGGKDLTVRSEQDRADMLAELFANLKAAPTEEDAKLVAEEVWAVFLQSGSASVDFLLMRGIAAQNAGDDKLARRMFDHVTRLSPDYAEGWSRSGRLALKDKDLNRAANDTLKALTIEPRHFYALWTLGNILETIEKPDKAFEAYLQAHEIYPLHAEIKARVEALRKQAQGQAL